MAKQDTVTALLPCRAGSERIKNKNTMPFADTTLFQLKLKHLLSTPEISSVLVSTDDDKIKQLATAHESDRIRIIEREEYFASSVCTTDELITYFADSLPVQGHLLWTHVTSPFITQAEYSQAINFYRHNQATYDSLVSVQPLREFIWSADGKPINYGTYKGWWPRTQDLEPLMMINSGIFLLPFDVMQQKKDRVGERPFFFACDWIQSLDVDTIEDFNVCELIYQTLKK